MGGRRIILCSSISIGLGFVDPISLIILAFLASRGYVALFPTIMTSLVLVKLFVIVCRLSNTWWNIVNFFVFISIDFSFISNKQGSRFTKLLFDVCFMVDSWKILPNNSASVWFGVLLWVVTNGHHEGGSEARRDVTYNDSRITSLATTASCRAPCHSSRNLVTDCDSNWEKENMHSWIPTWEALCLC